MAAVPPKRSRESDDEEIDANDQLVDPAPFPLPSHSSPLLILTLETSSLHPVVSADAAKRKRGRPASSNKKSEAVASADAGTEANATDPTGTATGDPAPAPIKTPEEIAAEEAKKNRPPAKRGRPRKKPKVDDDAPAVGQVEAPVA
ncbi:hypothetical protein FRC17_010557 [Serendipita sp. 399]|nr:hypothetical protein FRC17_010557 [Serendipita sp. 399]